MFLLFFQTTSETAFAFILPQHNISTFTPGKLLCALSAENSSPKITYTFCLVGLHCPQCCASFCHFLPDVEGEVSLYRYGWRDCITTTFYFLIAIIFHAAVQEYILDVSTWPLGIVGSVHGTVATVASAL